MEKDVLVRFFGFFENTEAVFLAMEFFPYGDLAQYLKSPMTEHEIKRITEDLLEGLKIMHAEGFTHRDLKPNVHRPPSHVNTSYLRLWVA